MVGAVLDKLQAISLFRSLKDIFVRSTAVAILYIIFNRFIKQDRLLHYNGNLLSDLLN